MEQLLKENMIRVKLQTKKNCYKVFLDDYRNESELLDNIAGIIFENPAVVILYGDKQCDSDFINITEKIKVLCDEFDAVLMVYKRADLTFLTDADGVYLDNQSITPHQAREIIGENKFICLESAEQTVDNHVDFKSSGNKLFIGDKTISILEITK